MAEDQEKRKFNKIKDDESIGSHKVDHRFVKEESDDETGTGESGKGGKSGVEFVDFLGTGENLGEEPLTEEERRRLLSVHDSTHEIRVKKQKETRDQRNDLKNGKIPLDAYRQGLNSGVSSQYKANPILANKAQFSGIDRQVKQLPNENVSETNNEKREELDYQYRLRYQPENAPRFNPKPQYR